ncbi:MAG: hypothetical protein ACQEXJ_22535 [Myxococcota bacterium]
MTASSEEGTSEELLGLGASPLAMLIRDEHTHDLLERLGAHLAALRRASRDGEPRPELVLSRTHIAYVRQHWESSVLQGERRLYGLATLLAWNLLRTRSLQLVARIIASPRDEREPQRITIEEILSREDLERHSDYSLADRLAARYRYRSTPAGDFGRLYPRASFLEFRPLETVDVAPATRVLTRVKIEDQIWNKVCDAFFDIDRYVRRDKILNQQSKYIKDVFGIKVLTPHRDDSYRVADAIRDAQFDPADLEPFEFTAEPRLHLIERKDYLVLPEEQKKATGWEALKDVYRWSDRVFEIQIQTEANYFLEAWDLSKTSHRTFEMQREVLREVLDQRVPHYREFRQLLKALFRGGRPGEPAVLPPWVRLEP